uniref:Fructose-bisphosphatase n=1 Tax=Chlamydomonas leiostraca TaxID=1034604 RepID=A0A7S0RNY2_9CHLO|mmetsp:Transcript_27422/g.69739  ORF Transcript_27422/g.69739 Transcript_27422/m.69739 type:complete len:422 (+) Transcript_27422:207-1472(+)|eukprot:CAMPEP_0202865668 /NCGR_PEP_ID=MMETSP1391-20130828/6285_1 /ASSEMBLY_ACC=CAM_ASM_000867 /TAXON_ID=1034604 /ORGANISM="Chlamydomonas leiostraca, Strain SAG 11-49" /LENGTH=421 /DNA_ID=CAMNT_0049545533 /DNA_START=202 /DNA_END=1467 /DNA_ORIENTATION=-
MLKAKTPQSLLRSRGNVASVPLAPAVHAATAGTRPVLTRAGAGRVPSSQEGPDYSAVQRNLALELVRVTEAAALASGRWLGKGDKNAADQAAVDMMRKVLNSVQMEGVVVIGEGEKDEAPMLYCGERIGDGSTNAPAVDIAVDPLDGTTLTAQGRNGAISVIAVAKRGSLFDPGPCMYMEKLAVGPEVPPGAVSLNYSVKRNLAEVAAALRKPISDVTVVMLDRPRHADLIRQCREAGARIRLISDGDVGGAIEVAKAGGPVDILMGIGGTPEGVIAAAALKCMGGTLQGRLWPRSDEEAAKARAQGYDLKKVLTLDDLVKGDDVFFAATGVTDGDLLRGVRYYSGGASTNSMVMRCASGTVRFVETFHRWAKPSVTNIPLEELAGDMSMDSGHVSDGSGYAGGTSALPLSGAGASNLRWM